MLIREFYRETLNEYKNNHRINDVILRSLIIKAEGISDMSQFFLCLDNELKNEITLNKLVDRVLNGEPYQYVINEQEFYKNKYYVDNRVLIPRLETEELVDELIKVIKKQFSNQHITVADIGTGSGCIAISLAKNIDNIVVFASDISKNALEVASLNALNNNVQINFLCGNMLEPLIDNKVNVDVIVSNPPYITNKEDVDDNVINYEPHLALFVKKGTQYYENILANCKEIINKTAIIAFEFNYDQKDEINDLINKYYPNANIKFYKDMFNNWRFVIFCINN